MDVMGTREMSDAQLAHASRLRAAFETLNGMLTPPAETPVTADAARLFAIARTQLELSCLAAVKAVSRM